MVITSADMVKWTLVIVLLLIAVLVVTSITLRYLRRHEISKAPSPAERCAHCGYDLAGLDIPRCPECGSVIGFDKTFSELGIDESEVREHLRQSKAGEP